MFSLIRTCRFAVFVVLVMGTVPRAFCQDPAGSLEETLIKLIEKVEPSVVSIARIKPPPPSVLRRNERFGPFGPGLERGRREAERNVQENPEHPEYVPNDFGVGILIATGSLNERFVLTNYHVVRGGPIAGDGSLVSNEKLKSDSVLTLKFSDRRSCPASIIAADPRSDLAVLIPDFSRGSIDPSRLKPLDWSQSPPIRKGQFVVMLGNPYALARDGSASASWGMISNVARHPLPWTKDMVASSSLYRLGNLVQIDGRMNLGTSGGPVVNLKGDLIGMTTSLAAVDGYEKSAGFAIPFDEMSRRIIKSLIAGHEVEYGMLGISPIEITQSEFQTMNTGVDQPSAAGVHNVTPGSPAHQAGIEVGDALLKIGEKSILSVDDLMRIVGLNEPGTEVSVTVFKRGSNGVQTVKVKLGKWPVLDDEGIIATKSRWPIWRGVSVDYPTARQRFMREGFHDAPYRQAVLVTKVMENSPGQVAELQPGDFISVVNGIPVQTPSEFHTAVKKISGPATLSLYQGRTSEDRTVVIKE